MLKPFHSGKVRDMYDLGDDLLAMVASDRISAFDVILPQPVPDKGRVLTAMSVFWFETLADLAPNHFVSADPQFIAKVLAGAASRSPAKESGGGGNPFSDAAGRMMLVKRAGMLPIECIVRGYLAGSAWKEYVCEGTINRTPMPEGLVLGSRLPEPMFTPTTKAEVGHDQNITFDEAANMVGSEVAALARDLSLAAYSQAADVTAQKGFILADTKFELGFIGGDLCLADEVVTPDSSRLWMQENWTEGEDPPAYDKQPVRDWLEAVGWDKLPPPPDLPPEVVEETTRRYTTAYEIISGRHLTDWYGA